MSDPHIVSHEPDLVLARVESFARALDAGDFGTAGDGLHAECECVDGPLRVRGAEAVIALYRAAASWAERGFDDVRHTSAVARAARGDGDRGGAVAHPRRDSVRVVVTTYVMHVPGRWHRLRHVRDIAVGADGRIESIVHRCDAEAAEAFRVFVRESGAEPPSPGFGV